MDITTIILIVVLMIIFGLIDKLIQEKAHELFVKTENKKKSRGESLC